MIYAILGRETIASLATSVGFTAAQIPPTAGKEGIEYALIQALGGDVRITSDGTAPVAATTGLRLLQNSLVEVWGADAIRAFRAIDDGGTATLEVVYYGREG
jgi:hypothetical protein